MEFPEGWRGVRKTPFHRGGMDIYWNYTLNQWRQKCSLLQVFEPLTSKLQLAANYWTIDVKDYWTTIFDREIMGTRLCYLTKREMAANGFTSLSEENILNE